MAALRLVHNVPLDILVDVYLNDYPLALNLAYGDITAYLPVPYERLCLSVRPAGTEQVLISTYFDAVCNESTVLITGLPDSLELVRYQDDNTCPCPGFAHVRFIHGAPDAPAVDVLADGSIIFANVSYLETGYPVYLPVPAGRVNLSVTLAGSPDPVVGPLPFLLAAGGIYTVIASGLVGSQQFPLTALVCSNDPLQCDKLQPDFDAAAYMGKWWQIASIPQPFAQGCTRQIAEYTLLKEEVKVVNRCLDSRGEVVETVTGRAEPVAPGAFIVSFPQFPLPPQVNYLVHATNYVSYALVGSPDRSSLFILARKSKISERRYKKLLHLAAKLGYNVNAVVVDSCAVY